MKPAELQHQQKTQMQSCGHRSGCNSLLSLCSLKCNKGWSQEIDLAESRSHGEKCGFYQEHGHKTPSGYTRGSQTRLAASVACSTPSIVHKAQSQAHSVSTRTLQTGGAKCQKAFQYPQMNKELLLNKFYTLSLPLKQTEQHLLPHISTHPFHSVLQIWCSH